MSTEDVKNTKTSLREKKKDELIAIILRKDDVEIKLKSELEQANAKKDDTFSKLNALKKEYSNLEDQNKTLNERIDDNKNVISKLTDELKSANNKISALTEEKNHLQSKNNTMHVELENRAAIINKLKNINYRKLAIIFIIAIIGIVGWFI